MKYFDEARTLSPAEQVHGVPLFQMAHADAAPAEKQAAVNAQDHAAAHRDAILKALEYFGVRGATAKEIAVYLGGDWTSVMVTRRMRELRIALTVDTLDGLTTSPEPGHRAPAVERDGCHVHVVRAHSAACAAIYTAEQARVAQMKLAQGIVA